ncbi:MAG: type II secretion system protein [Candidatus Komeilibacteria bacterium]
MKLRQQMGFTLIELLTVISIMTLLSSITIANVNDTRRSARDAIRLQDTRNILTVLQAYYIDHGEWPYMTTAMDSSPANVYPSCSRKICQTTEDWLSLTRESEYYTRCASITRCSCGNGPDWPTNWLPLLDGTFDPNDRYFSPLNPPIDPSEKNCQYDHALPGFYTYMGWGGSSRGSIFYYVYFLERPNPNAPGLNTGCGEPIPGCYYMMVGLSDGTIEAPTVAPVLPE